MLEHGQPACRRIGVGQVEFEAQVAFDREEARRRQRAQVHGELAGDEQQAVAIGRHHDLAGLGAAVATGEAGEGIGHQLMLERGRVLPGTLAVGADSHAVSYGALNAFGSGIGSSDLAGILQCNQLWLKVPGSRLAAMKARMSGWAALSTPIMAPRREPVTMTSHM